MDATVDGVVYLLGVFLDGLGHTGYDHRLESIEKAFFLVLGLLVVMSSEYPRQSEMLIHGVNS